MKSCYQRARQNKICFDFKWKERSTLISIRITLIFRLTTMHKKIHIFQTSNSTLFLFYNKPNLLQHHSKDQFRLSSVALRTSSALQNKKCYHLFHLKSAIKTYENLQDRNQNPCLSHLIQIRCLTYIKVLFHQQKNNLLRQFRTSK